MKIATVPVSAVRAPGGHAGLLDELRRCAITHTVATITVDLESPCYGAFRARFGPLAERWTAAQGAAGPPPPAVHDSTHPAVASTPEATPARRGCSRCRGRDVRS